MMHPHTEVRFINKEMGYGVVATKFIPRGTITWVQDELDRVFTAQEVDKMRPVTRELVDKYSFRNNKGHFVLCWDLSKYVNHSFRSNCISTVYDFELAVRDIHPGEQLTDDYGYLNVSEPFKAQDEGTERDTVYPDDLCIITGNGTRSSSRLFHILIRLNSLYCRLCLIKPFREFRKS